MDNKTRMKLIRSLSLSLFIFGLIGWFYIAVSAWVHPASLTWAFTQTTLSIRQDTFGIISFFVSFVSFFIWVFTRPHNSDWLVSISENSNLSLLGLSIFNDFTSFYIRCWFVSQSFKHKMDEHLFYYKSSAIMGHKRADSLSTLVFPISN